MHRAVLAVVAILLLASVGCRSASSESAATIVDPPVSTSVAAAPTTESTTAPVVTGLAPGDYTFELEHDGRSRSYIAHIPSGLVAPAAVVIALHGGGGTGADFQDQNGLDVVADRESFVVLYPEGTGILPRRLHTWNSGDTCCGYAFDRNVDDVGFLRAVLRDIDERTAIDADRIYLTGHSNGAMMAYRFAVETSGLVAALVPVGGAADLAQPEPAMPIALLHIHSADDPRALYHGGEGPPFPGTDRTVHHEPVLPMVETWASANGCASTVQLIETVTGSGDNDGHRLDRFAWPGCAGAPVEHLVLHGSGHGWPGVVAPRLVQRHLGPPTTLIEASEEIWAFVSQFERVSDAG